ncbi:DUF2142 domain-containing protein [Curtobacterium sp. NPDC090217]|uniref:DUF2142 domain-containing protein n=1 Tax=Curtobacterium sp. NPDC090217 TaxID=3363970 RepID=UPI0037FBB90E
MSSTETQAANERESQDELTIGEAPAPPVRRSGPGAWIECSWQSIAFLLVFLLGGAAFIAATPPGLNPDEPAHVYRAYQVAHGGMIADEAHGIQGIHDGDRDRDRAWQTFTNTVQYPPAP